MGASLTKRKVWLAAVMAVGALTLAACNRQSPLERPPEAGDRAVARVNGKIVWASDVKREAVAQGRIGQGEPLDISSDLFRQMMDEVIDRKLLAAEAVARKLDQDPAAQQRMAAARERVLETIMLETQVGRAVNEDAMKALYQEMLRYQTPSEELHLRQIVVATQPEADQIKKLLAANGSFDAIAAERSKDDATRFKGGMLPPMTSDMLPGAYAAPLKDAKPGQVVGPFRTDAGWVVLRVDERKQEAPIAFDAARPQIIHFLTDSQVEDLILAVRKKAKVESLIPPPQAVPGGPREPASAPPASAALPAATPPAAAAPPAAAGAPPATLKPAQGVKP